ncbi:hypothetical protein ABIB85_008276 [Bradyrhizobium sp. JR1.5]|uniref:hypothetical protein n=1 Tax=unclassified Bradyrhizobium TaxID=2631580 RepID=UPI003395F72A
MQRNGEMALGLYVAGHQKAHGAIRTYGRMTLMISITMLIWQHLPEARHSTSYYPIAKRD